jgi:hypothetical protein
MINFLSAVALIVMLLIMVLSLQCRRWEETMKDSEEEK